MCASHEAEKSGELSLMIGEEVTIVGKGEGETVKARCLQTLNVGYVPSHLLREEYVSPPENYNSFCGIHVYPHINCTYRI